jgi:hypothetical protein
MRGRKRGDASALPERAQAKAAGTEFSMFNRG